MAYKLDVDDNYFQVTLVANGKSADCSVEEEPLETWKIRIWLSAILWINPPTYLMVKEDINKLSLKRKKYIYFCLLNLLLRLRGSVVSQWQARCCVSLPTMLCKCLIFSLVLLFEWMLLEESVWIEDAFLPASLFSQDAEARCSFFQETQLKAWHILGIWNNEQTLGVLLFSSVSSRTW